MRYCIIIPFLKINNFEIQLDNFHFFLLVLATILLAAAGYVINDYFDAYTDQLNKPEKIIIGKQISRSNALILHLVLNIIGVGLGVYLSFYINLPGLSIVFIVPAGLLWFYSTSYKRQFVIGNFIVSFMTAGVPMLVIFYELPLLNKTYGEIMVQSNTSFNYIFFWIAGFSLFAFLTTLLREIIKDAEDLEGDSAYGMNTIPIVLGTKVTRIIMLSLIIFIMLLLFWVLLRYILITSDFIDYLSGIYFILFLFIPLIILFIKLIYAGSKRDYFIASQLTKGIMVAGILYAFLVRYILLFQLD